MSPESGEVWRFSVAAEGADAVFLVSDPDGLPCSWLAMQPDGGTHWELTLQITPGRYRFRYYISERGTILNCGTVGLTAGCLSPRDPSVHFTQPLQIGTLPRTVPMSMSPRATAATA